MEALDYLTIGGLDGSEVDDASSSFGCAAEAAVVGFWRIVHLKSRGPLFLALSRYYTSFTTPMSIIRYHTVQHVN